MDRRSFLGLTLSAASLSAARAAAPAWDYVIVGAGSAGLPAAIFAARRGARVLLIEAAPDIGGTLHIAFGQMSAAGTLTQRAKGIEDSPQRHFDDAMRLARGLSNPGIVRLAVEEAPGTVNWLLEAGLRPLPDHPVTGASPGRPGYSVPRYLWAEDKGRAILAVVRRELEPEVASGRVSILLNTRATSLLTRGVRQVVGVRARGPDGGVQEHFGRYVLLTTGGYAMNPVLFEKLIGAPPYTGGAHPYALGDGLGMAQDAGAVLRGRDLHRAGGGSILSGFDFPAKIDGRLASVVDGRDPWEIWVNVAGARFLREDEPDGYERDCAVARQPRFRYAVVFDEAGFRAAPPVVSGWTRAEIEARFNVHPMFVRADSLEALARAAGIDPVGLAQTVAAYDVAVSRGRDELGRAFLPRPISQPPFHAITLLGHSSTSAVGVTVDDRLRVTDGHGVPIAGLYAAGEVLGSGVTLGRAFVGGMLLTPALSLGRMLGRTLPV